MVTTTYSLQRARSGFNRSRSNHAITVLSMFMFNTNVLTTLVNVSMLVTFLVLPGTGIWAGIALVDMKIFVNSFLAVLNSREYLRENFNKEQTTQFPAFRTDYSTSAVLDISRDADKYNVVV
jgi:ABC-type transport system involved in Fe-S cluster assembly fused permease/ATPase subunit